MMTRELATATAAALLALTLWQLPGCQTERHTTAPRIDTRATIEDGARKDAAIETEAQAIARHSGDSEFVRQSAERILDILRLSPWTKTEATIKALVAERDSADKAVSELRRQIEEERAKTDRWIRLGLAGLGAVFIAGGVVIAVLAAKAGGIFVGLGPTQAGAVALGGVALLFASFAYGWALRHQSLVIGAVVVSLVAAAALWWANHHHARAVSGSASEA